MTSVRAGSVSSMSRKLLEGYAMLADSCETCRAPLLRKPGGTPICVNCGEGDSDEDCKTVESADKAKALPKSQKKDEAGRPNNVLPEEEQLLQAPPALRESLQVAEGGQSLSLVNRSSLVSQKIADKLLEGWALLDDYCPRCMTPLLRNRAKQLYCTSCDMFAVWEAPAPPVTKELPRMIDDGETAVLDKRTESKLDPGHAAQIDSGSTHQEDPTNEKVEVGLVKCLNDAASAISAKMVKVSERLGSSNPERSKVLLDLLRNSAITLSAIQDCKKKVMLKERALAVQCFSQK